MAESDGHQCQPSRSKPRATVSPTRPIGSGGSGGCFGGYIGSPASPDTPMIRSFSTKYGSRSS